MIHAIIAVTLAVVPLLLLVAMALAIVRIVRGPRAQDRVAALDVLYVDAMLLLLGIGIRTGSLLYVAACLVIAILGFASTAAFAKLLMRGEVIE